MKGGEKKKRIASIIFPQSDLKMCTGTRAFFYMDSGGC